MAEAFRALDKTAGAGMKTDSDALVEAVAKWSQLRDDAGQLSFAWFKLDKTVYRLVAEGSSSDGGLEAMAQAAAQDSSFVYFGAARVRVQGKVRFIHLLYIPAQASALQKGKAQLHKSAIFNAWPGSSAEVSVQDVQDIPNAIAAKLRCAVEELQV